MAIGPFSPTTTVTIDWGNLGSPIVYYSQQLPGQPYLKNVSGMTERVDRTMVSNAAHCSITIVDTTAVLQAMLSTTRMERSGVTISNQNGYLMSGETRGIQWSEGRREVTFQVIPVLKQKKVGYEIIHDPAIGVIPAANNLDAAGKCWPICFGKVFKSDAILVQKMAQAVTTTRIAVPKVPIKNDTSNMNPADVTLTPVLTTANTMYADFVDLKQMEIASKYYATSAVPGDAGVVVEDTGVIYLENISMFLDSEGEPPEEAIKIEIKGVIFKGILTKESPEGISGIFTIDSTIGSDLDPETVGLPESTGANIIKFENVNVGLTTATDDGEVDFLGDGAGGVAIFGAVLRVEPTAQNVKRRFVGNYMTFSYVSASHPDHPSSRHIFCSKVVQQVGMKIVLAHPLPAGTEYLFNPTHTGYPTELVPVQFYGTHFAGIEADINQALLTLKVALAENQKELKAADKNSAKRTAIIYKALAAVYSTLWSAPENSIARLWNDGATGDVYIANGVPSTDFINIYWQQGELIPSNWYHVTLNASVTLKDENGVDAVHNCTTVVFPYPLDSFKQPAPKEKTHHKLAYKNTSIETISCTLESSISENPVDQISYLLGFTSLSPGLGFAAVRDKLENYPAHWTLTEQKDTLDLIKDIAYQARIGLRFNATTLDIFYLAEAGASSATLNETNGIAESLYGGFSEDSKLATKSVVHWKPTGLPETIIKKTFNTDKFGTYGYGHLFEPKMLHLAGAKESPALVEIESQTYFIYNNRAQVDTVSKFWLNRHACTWRQMKVKVTPDISASGIFDWVTLSYASGGLSGVGMIIGRDVDSVDSLQGYTVWMPQSPDVASPETFAFGPELDKVPHNPADAEVKEYSAGFYELATNYEGSIQEVTNKAAVAAAIGDLTKDIWFNAKVTAIGWYNSGTIQPNTKHGHCMVNRYGNSFISAPTESDIKCLTGVLVVKQGMRVRVHQQGNQYVVKSIIHGKTF